MWSSASSVPTSSAEELEKAPPPAESKPEVGEGEQANAPEAPTPTPTPTSEPSGGQRPGCPKRKLYIIGGAIAATVLVAVIITGVMLYLYVFKNEESETEESEHTGDGRLGQGIDGKSNKGKSKADNSKAKAAKSKAQPPPAKANYADKTCNEDFQVYAFKEHNKLRADHEAAPLTSNVKLCQQAFQCAEYYLRIQKIDHSCPHKFVSGNSGDIYGENIYMYRQKKKPAKFTVMEYTKKAVEGWYREWEWYDFDKGLPKYPNNASLPTGHFTQMVWLDAKEMGTGTLISKDGKSAVVVSLYNPHGNWRNEYVNYVKRKKNS